MLDLAIVGGGPGGLMSAWYLKRKLGDLCRVTIFEASNRLGGKIVTRKFDSAPAMYEAGVAEIYDYSMTGPDPLRELIQHFGLQTIPMDAEQVQLDGELLADVPGMRRKYGAKTAAAIEAFRKRCAELVSPIEYYEGVGAHDNEHPWAYKTAEQILDEELPGSIIIAGSGAIGVEFAYVMKNFGVDVTIVEFLDRMVPTEDADVSKELLKQYKKLGVKVLLGTKVEGVEDTGDRRAARAGEPVGAVAAREQRPLGARQ